MPELPEVETIRVGLNNLIIGKVVKSVKVFDSPRSFPNPPAQVNQFLIGSTVKSARRRAKVLLIDLTADYTLVVHLKMTGQLVFRGQENFGGGHPTDSLIGRLPDRSTRVRISFDDNSELFFNDQRKFGWVKLIPTAEVDQLDFFRKVGPEPLDEQTTPSQFIQRIRRHNGMMVKPAILDQAVIAGVGNIYADEALWQAKIHPQTRVRDLSDGQLRELFVAIVDVLTISLNHGGSTDRNYVDAKGEKGSYLQFAKVFRREGQPCYRHPDVLIEKIRVAGRGTHICPVCQQM